MISLYSRYYAQTEERNGNTNVVALKQSFPIPNYITHVARDGDSFEYLSTRYLGSPVFYWKIADLNPHVPYPDYIPVGTVVRIPR